MCDCESMIFMTHFEPGGEEKGGEAAIPLLSTVAQSEHPWYIILVNIPCTLFAQSEHPWYIILSEQDG